ncbi:MAG: nucleotidyltransferase domain-containing protein [Candidatus Cloacimonetes bacterium]|nr:nucleotidyltransferase domain-containing protein [Candidatus Cloacimonadota bacterium]
MNIVENNLGKIIEICKSHHIQRISVFGSVLSDNFSKKSDIDFLIKFRGVDLFEYFDNFLDLKNELEILFGRNVDLIEEQTLRNPYLIKSINRNRKLLWKKE